MTSIVYFLSTLVFALLISSAYCKPGEGMMPPISCSGTNLNITNATMAAMMSCKKTIVDPNVDASGNLPKNLWACPTVCTAKNLGIIDASGKIVADKMKAYIAENFPAAKQSAVNDAITSCFNEFGSLVQNVDNDCTSYKKLMHCGMKKIFTICEVTLPVPMSSEMAN